MSETVGGIRYDAVIDSKEFVANAKEIDKVAEDTSKSVGKSFDGAEKKSDGFAKGMRTVGLAMTAAGVALTAYAKSATDFTVDLVKGVKTLSRETGATTKESSRLIFVMKRLGISAEDASTVFGIFSKKLNEAAKQNKGTGAENAKLRNEIEKTSIQLKLNNAEIAKNGDKTGELRNKSDALRLKLNELKTELKGNRDAFQKLGVDVTDTSGKIKPFHDILLETSDVFAKMPDGPKKTALALELFGRSGKDMIKFLNLGSEGITNLEKEADRLGLTLNDKTVASIAAYVESSKKLKEQSDAMKLAVGELTAPVLTKFNEKLIAIVSSLTKTDSPMRKLTANVLAFGGPIATGAGALTSFIADAGTAAPVMGKLAGVFGKVPPQALLIGAAIAAAGIAINFIVQKMGGWAVAWNNLKTAMAPVVAVLKQIWSVLVTQLKAAWTDIMASINSLKQTLAPFEPQLRQLWNALKVVGAVITGVVIVAIVAFIAAVALVIAAIARVIGWSAKLYAAIVSKIVTGFRAVRDAIKLAQLGFQILVSSASAAMSRFTSAVSNGVSRVINFVRSIPGKIRGAIGNLGSLLFNAGVSLITGLVNGIKSAFGKVKQTLGELTSKLTSWKGPPSKDKILLTKNAELIIGGFVKGLESQYPKVQASLGGLTDSIGLGSSGGVNLDAVARNAGGSTVNSPTEYNIGTINIASEVDGEKWLRKLTRNTEIASGGLTPRSLGV